MKKMMSVLLILSFVLCGILPMQAAGEEEGNLGLYATSAVLMDGDSGRVLYEKDGQSVMPMASTTKIMSCIVALENGNPEDIVTVSSYAASQPKVHLGMRSGQQFQLRDLLYSMMLESHNDSAVAIAEHVGGSVENFAAMMNQKAKDIGCYDTFFITPNGLDAKATDQDGNEHIHSTTAADLARIMRYCILLSDQSEAFLEITRTPSYSFQDAEGKRSYSCSNHNAFLTMMEGAVSGKTGFTNGAGYCYIGALQRDGKTFIGALLACGWPNHKSWKWHDMKLMMDYGLSQYEYRGFETPEEIKQTAEILVEEGQTDRIGETAKVPVELISNEFSLLMREGEHVEVKKEIKEKLTAPVEKGTEIGTVTYLVNGQVWKQDYLMTAAGIDKINYRWCFEQVLHLFLISV